MSKEVLLAAFLLLGTQAALADAKKDCFDKSGEIAIKGCTELLRRNPKDAKVYLARGYEYNHIGDYDRALADYTKAAELNPREADAYHGRGFAYHYKGDYDRAISEYSRAIGLEPDNAVAYHDRGAAYDQKRDYDRALADYDKSIALKPKYAGAYFLRGVTHLYAGSLAKALADLNQASELDPKDAYFALWVDIVGQRSNLPSRLAQAIATVDMTAWPAPVLRMMLGQLTPAAVLAAADSPNASRKQGQACDANFYGGLSALRQDAKEEAARLFRLAADGCPWEVVERFAADAELRALGGR